MATVPHVSVCGLKKTGFISHRFSGCPTQQSAGLLRAPGQITVILFRAGCQRPQGPEEWKPARRVRMRHLCSDLCG